MPALVDPTEQIVRRLGALVAIDTQNPTADERPLAEMLAADLRDLGATSVEILEVEGHFSTFARFGSKPARLLLNAHLDTVPANTGYNTPPLTLTRKGDRVYGLGAADIKGAIACILQALHSARAIGRPADGVAVLFSGDEERGGTCMRDFLKTGRAAGIERAIVSEPTNLRIGQRHRGVICAEVSTQSPGGHSSRADDMPAPIAILSRAAVALDDLARRLRHEGPVGYQGICMNVATINGGVAFNVIPTRATLQICYRPAPGADVPALLATVETAIRTATAPASIEYTIDHVNPPFATRNLDGFAQLLGDRVSTPIDLSFWTEGALLVEHGIDAVVFGPGDIAHAHAADESVAINELTGAHDALVRALT